MPSPLNFDNTKTFRDFLISKTLNRPDGPQTFTSSNYSVQNLSNFSNVDPGDVKTNWEFYWNNSWSNNLYTQPNSRIEEYIETSLPLLVWINNGTVIQGYPQSFTPIRTNLVGIMTGQNFDDDSRLMRFATNNIRTNRQGPVFARVEQNLRTSLLGRVRVLDALNGNLSTALNLVTGRESLISRNYKITNNNSLLGKGVDFLQTVAGAELPFSTIPGDYLTNPRRPIENRPTPTSEFGAVVQDVTGVLGNLIGIQRRPKLSRKPSDLFIEYMGSGQKQVLFDQLSFSTYGPNYTTTARSQQSSRLFNVVNNFGGGVRQILGLEAPNNKSYIGDDRSEDVKYTMSDFNDNVVRSSYYLSIMFDPVQASLFERQRNISQGGPISTKLTWISKNSQNKIGLHNNEFQTVESNNFNESLSTKFGFREDSIMGKTQELLNSMPKDGLSSRTHVGNVIDQTSRIFKEGETMLSRGSAVKFVDKFNQETGAEFCRVWTKDRSYMNYSDTMKRTSNIRKFGDSIMGGNSSPWNINVVPTSSGQYDPTGKNSFGNENSTNIVESNNGDGFYAKKYMFSFENLAWRTSNTPGFTYNDLPFCERGPNGGRVMWFPPYDLKISENNQARWQDNTFLGRPEPIYTYQDTARSGQMSFKVVVDHPSILNLLTREYFKDMSDDESENYINAFFSGCEELDFYDLIRRFAQLDSNDIRLIQSYLNNGIEPELIQQYKVNTEFPVVEDPSSNTKGLDETISTPKLVLNYENDNPDIRSNKISTSINYSNSFNTFKTQKQNYVDKLGDSLNVLSSLSPTNPQVIREKEYVFGSNITINSNDIQKQKNDIIDLFDKSENNFNTYINEINKLVQDLSGKTAQDVYIKISSSCSSAADTDYNERLAMRRSHSVIIDVFDKIKSGVSPNIKWPNEFVPINKNNGENDKEIIQQGQPIVIKKEYTFKSFGYDYDGKIIIESFNYGEGFTGKDVNPIKECIDKNFIQVPQLGIYSPIAYKCRQTTFEMEYKRTSQKTKPSTPSPTPIITLEPNGQIPLSQPIRKASIDPLKRIIAKTLSECLYFKKIEKDDPLVFKSLKDKLKYFHPAFHSMTPEGLNARLTFLLQCIRPGDTIPIKGISEDSDLRARNTSFGPPPVCVLRIGDFYHSKVVIRDVNISYEEGGGMIWDLNPEGIGVQPMIATVTLSLNFIGGQGLTKPVERLQNALSSNFFANTEMYDERSISTLEGKDYEEFKREFLEDLNRSYVNINSRPETQSINNIIEGRYMGQFVNANTESNISYNNLLSLIEIQTKTYFDKFQSTYNEIFTKYGLDITTMLLSNTYRPINKYDIYTLPLPTPGRVIDLLGLHEKSKEVSVYIERLKFVLISFINNSSSTYLVNMLGFDKEIPSSSSIILANNKILKPFFIKIVEDVIDELNDLTSLKELEHSRNDLINSLDKINFVIKNGHDAVINEGVVNKVLLSGFTTDFLYDEYKEFIDYIEKNHTRVVEDLTTNITFLNPTITPQDFDFIMSQMVHDKVEEIMAQFTDETLFKKTTQRQMKRRLERFINKPEKKNFKLTRFKPLKTGKTFTYGWVSSSEETDSGIISEVKQIFSDSNEVKDKLNFYRKK